MNQNIFGIFAFFQPSWSLLLGRPSRFSGRTVCYFFIRFLSISPLHMVAKSPNRMMRVIERIVVLLSSIHHRFAVSMLCVFRRSIIHTKHRTAFRKPSRFQQRCYLKDFNTIDQVISALFPKSMQSYNKSSEQPINVRSRGLIVEGRRVIEFNIQNKNL